MPNSYTLRLRKSLQHVLNGTPWYGDHLYKVLDEFDPAVTFNRVSPALHSPIELIYHMNNWTAFVVNRLEKNPEKKAADFEKDGADWIMADPAKHNWQKAVDEFKHLNDRLLELFSALNDNMLSEMVDEKPYKVRVMLEGIIEHHVYHQGQLAYLKKFFQTDAENRVFSIL